VRRLLLVFAVMAVMAAMVAAMAVPAFAASPSQTQCESSGGTFDRSGGQVSCTFDAKNDKQPKFDSTTTSNGTLNNQPQKTEDPCGPCPPGQYK
jgi:predicted lipoprotein with Yx(FWY)xxD motif